MTVIVLYTSQSREGDIYDTLLPTIGINILDFTLFPELPAYHNFFMITEGREEGMKEGELEEKHNVLIRLLELKYNLSEAERKYILSVTDFKKLDAALDAIVLVKDKENVLKLL